MRHRTFRGLSLVSAAAALAIFLAAAPARLQAQAQSAAATQVAWSPQQQEVWAAVQELWALSSALDFDPWFDRVADDYLGWSVADRVPRGKAAWREQVQGRVGGPARVYYDIQPKAIVLHGDVAIAFYTYALANRTADGAISTSRGQWTDTFRRVGSRWLLVADAGGETGADENILVSTGWVAAHMDDPAVIVLQIESQPEPYQEGHLPGAHFLPYDRIAWNGETEVGAEFLPFDQIRVALEEVGVRDDSRVVVYSSQPLYATRLWLTLEVLGAGRVHSLMDGGLQAWTAEERRLSVDVPETPTHGALNIRPRPELVVDAIWVQDNLEIPSVALVDARPVGEYTGEGQTGERVGHIPGAGNAAWEDMIESRQQPHFRSLAEMHDRFLVAGAEADDTVVPYCVVGLRASLDYFVARLLGYSTRFYDGSWRDWTARGLPLVTGPNRW